MPLGCCEDSYYFLVGGVRVAAKARCLSVSATHHLKLHLGQRVVLLFHKSVWCFAYFRQQSNTSFFNLANFRYRKITRKVQI